MIPQKYPHFVPWSYKNPKMYSNNPQNSPISNDPQNLSPFSSYPAPHPKIVLFLWKSQKVFKFKVLNPQNGPSLYIILKNQSTPLPHPETYNSMSPGQSVVGWTDCTNKTIASLIVTVSSFKTTAKSPHSLKLCNITPVGMIFFIKSIVVYMF